VTPDVVLLGNLLVDDLVFPDGRTRMGQPGGAMLYSSLALALWGTRAGCVAPRGDDYPADALAHLARRGVMLDGITPLGRPGVRTWLLYEGRVRRVVHRLGCPTHEEVSPRPGDVPGAWRGARCFHLGPIPIAMQAEAARALGGGGALVSLDPHELVTEASLPRWLGVLEHADLFWPSEDELRLDDAQTDPHAALRRLATPRLKYVLYKRGLKGGVLYDVKRDAFLEWSARTNGVQDPTGAGDAFAAGFLSALLEGGTVEECLRRGVVTASFAIEAWGPVSLLEATRADAEARLEAWYGRESVS
jgi:sugar/nucleoside kinase (ribokinase family)